MPGKRPSGGVSVMLPLLLCLSSVPSELCKQVGVLLGQFVAESPDRCSEPRIIAAAEVGKISGEFAETHLDCEIEAARVAQRSVGAKVPQQFVGRFLDR